MEAMERKRFSIFIMFTFAVTWGVELLLALNGGLSGNLAQVGIIVAMLIPAVGNLFTRKVTAEGFGNLYLRPNFRGNIRWYLLAWLGTTAAVVIGCVLYFLLNPSLFDPNMDYYVGAYQELYAQHGMDYTTAEIREALILQVTGGILFGPFLSLPKGFGLELGFRGYMMPKLMDRFSVRTSLLLGGLIWGVWFDPLIGMGLYYGTDYPLFPIPGLLAIILFCMIVGIILSFLTWKTKSCIPAVIAYAVIDGYGSIGMYFCSKDVNTLNLFLGPSVAGFFAAAGLVLLALLCLYLFSRENDAKSADR